MIEEIDKARAFNTAAGRHNGVVIKQDGQITVADDVAMAAYIYRLSEGVIGDLLAANNLSDVANAARALNNLGGLAINGSNSPTADIDWGGFGIANISLIQDSSNVVAVDIGNRTLNSGGDQIAEWTTTGFQINKGLIQVGTNYNYGTTNTITIGNTCFVDTNGAGTGTTTYNIDTPNFRKGTILYISDCLGKSAANNIVIDSGVGNTIRSTTGAARTYTISTNGQCVMMRLFEAGKWIII